MALAAGLSTALLTACDDATGLAGKELRVEGTVRALYDSVPIPGAEVTLDVVGLSGTRAWAATTSDSTGAYVLELSVPGGCTDDSAAVVIRAEKPDHDAGMLGGPGSPFRVACGRSSTADLEPYRTIFRNPQPVAGELVATQVSLNRGHACAITTQGAYCWGDNRWGELGDPSFTDDHAGSPVPVAGGGTFVQISVGESHTCAVDSDGAAWCWGWNWYGQVGADTSVYVVGSPRQLDTDLRFSQVQAGRAQSCGLTTDGAVYCWGWSPALGIDDSSGELHTTPQPVLLEGRYVEISASYTSSCAVSETGAAYCWGFSYRGELGNGETSGWFYTPVEVTGGYAWTTVDAGSLVTCGLTLAGAAHCWGAGDAGQLGDGSVTERMGVPVTVAGGLTFTDISATRSHICALDAGGAAHCWGSNADGALGTPAADDEACTIGPCVTTPVAVPTALRFSATETGVYAGEYTCGITTDQELFCWGDRAYLGSGRTIRP